MMLLLFAATVASTPDIGSSDSGFAWLTTIVLPLIVALIGGGATAAGLNRLYTRADHRRDRYAEAVSALIAWTEYPYRIRRRTDDTPETLATLAGYGHDLQERLARNSAWITTEHPEMGRIYRELIGRVKSSTATLIEEAWTSPPVGSSADMITNGWGAETAKAMHEEISAFQAQTAMRFGWHRCRRPQGST